MNLNSLDKINKKKIRVGRGIGQEKEKPHLEVIKGRNQGLEWQLKVLKVDKCLCIEDFQKEVLNL